MKTILLASVLLAPLVLQGDPADVAPVEEGVRLPLIASESLRPGEAAPRFLLPDARGIRVSSGAWLGQSALLVISVSAPAPNEGDRPWLDDIVPLAPDAPLAPEQVLAARRVAEAVQAASRLKGGSMALVVIAGGSHNGNTRGSYFRAMREAMGAFKPAVLPEAHTPDAPNLFVLQDDPPVAENVIEMPFNRASRRKRWRDLVGLSQTGVSLTAIDRAGFVRSNEAVDDLASLEPLLALTGDTSPRLEIGQPAPDFSLRDAGGRARRLSDLRGRKNLLLSFFPRCFTGRCANHLSSLGAEKLAFQSVSTEVWAASFDPAEGERGQLAFARQLGLGFPLIPDVGRNLALLYGAATTSDQAAPARMTVLIDRDGIVRWIDRAIQVRTHGPDVLQKIRELGLK